MAELLQLDCLPKGLHFYESQDLLSLAFYSPSKQDLWVSAYANSAVIAL